MKIARRKVAIIYHFFPHYRAPILRELAQSNDFSFEFWGDHTGAEGVRAFQGDASLEIKRINYSASKQRLGRYLGQLIKSDADAFIILGNPNILDTWIIALIGRILKRKILFWSHGWLRPEPIWKAKIRNLYFGLADAVLTYDDRSVELAHASGFRAEKVFPIYNSLDWKAAQKILGKIKLLDRETLCRTVGARSDVLLLVCSARLTKLCKLELVLRAMSLLAIRGIPSQIILVGDGPEKDNLEALAQSLNVDAVFWGAVYDEDRVGTALFVSDITVSPGKVGLTATHSLMYGTPVVTHSNRDSQMPEVEAITPAITGELFLENDVASLADTLENWQSNHRDRSAVREACWGIVKSRYNPENQKRLIEKVLHRVFGE